MKNILFVIAFLSVAFSLFFILFFDFGNHSSLSVSSYTLNVDSVKRAAVLELQQHELIAMRNNQRIKTHDSLILDCKKKITALVGTIEYENLKVADINQFHFLRLRSEKEHQLSTQIALINRLNFRLIQLRDSLSFFDRNY